MCGCCSCNCRCTDSLEVPKEINAPEIVVSDVGLSDVSNEGIGIDYLFILVIGIAIGIAISEYVL